jgi:surfeit locus 1 family protein
MKLERLLSRQWWKTTLLVLAAIGVMVRLGIWQLDRLAQRKAFNNRAEAQLAQPALDLTSAGLDLDFFNMEYRDVLASGKYDHQQQIVLRNQDWQGNLGVHILTPLVIEGSERAILVDRGWVPYEDYTSGSLVDYDLPGLVNVSGVIRRTQVKPRIGGQADQVPEPGEPPLDAWYWVNINQIEGQMPYELLPVYLQEAPDPTSAQLPFKASSELDLSEGPHLGYAFQWFIFAAILAIGYPIYVKREESRKITPKDSETPYIQSADSESNHQESENKGYKNA